MSIIKSAGKANVASSSVFEESLVKLAEIYASEFKELKARGAKLVQLEEPAIIQYPDEFSLLKSAYDIMMKEKSVPETLMALYFGNATPLVNKLTDLQVDGICFDFIYSSDLESRFNGFPKNIGLGIVDGRNTKMENVSDMARFAEKIIKASSAEKVYVTSSCGLEFLPRNRAYDKLKLCADIARVLAGGSR
jgi:5-methyltetrahydropteroyltriglutamate--homocysteine methyltransferase